MAKIEVRVVPKAGKNEIVAHDGVWRVRVTAAPEDGKANKAVCKLIAARFGVPQSAVRVVRGETARQKTIEIDETKAR